MSDRIQELEQQLSHYNDLYYNQDEPEISDYEYDQLVKELKKLNPTSKVLQDLGQPVYGVKQKHQIPMGSLNKVHTAPEVRIALGGNGLVAMPKIDGLSLSLIYKNGVLSEAITRGNGEIGEIVTENAKQISNIPLTISSIRSRVEVRGEVYVDNQWFYSSGTSNNFKNPRNYAAGSLKQKNPQITKERNLSFVAYRIFVDGTNNSATKSIELQGLKNLNFEVPVSYSIQAETTSSAPYTNHIEEVIKKFEMDRKSFHFDIDGIVFWIDNLSTFTSFGLESDDKTPKGTVAYKFDTDKVETTVLNIEWTTSRTGKIIPVMIVIPVEIAGTTVRRITLNNPDYISKHNVAIGDKVIIEKANEIIPQLVQVIERPSNRRLNIPSNCPSCGVIPKMDGAHLYCNNVKCSAQISGALLYFIQALDMKGFSAATVEKILSSGILDNKSIFDFTEEDFISTGMGAGNSKNFFNKLHNLTLSKVDFLKSLGIERGGRSTWEKILELYEFDDVIEGKLSENALSKVDGIGSLVAKSIREGLLAQQTFILETLPHIKIIEDLPSIISSATNVKSKLQNKSFCITGTLSEKRSVIEQLIKSNGGKVSSVSRSLDYLIVGTDSGSKLLKAKQLGIKTLSESAFRKML